MSKIILDADDFLMKDRKNKVLSELDELEDLESEMISSYRPKKKKKEKESEEKIKQETDAINDWLETVEEFNNEPIQRSRNSRNHNVFEHYGKKKKKKKKKDGELTDFNKEFEPEQLMIDEVLKDHCRFLDDLQRQYYEMTKTKSSARGVGKYTTDLASSISDARKLTLDIVKEKASIKKTVADLKMKEKKDLSAKNNADNDDELGFYSAKVLKNMINDTSERDDIKEMGISDDLEDLYDNINNEIEHTSDEEETNKYLKYEKAGVNIYLATDKSTGENYFVAKDKDGNDIPDYPLPEMEDVTINERTGFGTDKYNREYKILD